MENLKGCFSHNSDDWATPQKLFDVLDAEFNFNLDPCASVENHKCDLFYTEADNGLSKNWGGTECFVIHLIRRLVSGLRKHLGKQEMTIRSL